MPSDLLQRDSRWGKVAQSIDGFSRKVGRGTAWLSVAMVLVGSLNAIARYLGKGLGFSLASNRYLELQWYLFSLVFLLAASYTLERGAHVRVDVLYSRLRPRTRHWIDLLGTIFLLIPFCLFSLWVSWPAVINSWMILEQSPDPGGLPRYPIKTAILLCFAMLLLQAVAEIIKTISALHHAYRAPGEVD